MWDPIFVFPEGSKWWWSSSALATRITRDKMTSNPSEEQLELVTSRIVDIAQAVCPFIALDDNSYFDEAGFVKDMAAELQRRLTIYIAEAEGVEPSLEDHPQPRRMARYLLENVEYDVLEVPLASPLLAEFSPDDVKKPDAPLIAGIPRQYILAAVAALVLVLIFLAFFFSTGAPAEESLAAPKHDHTMGRHGGRGKGGGWRNGSGAGKE